jgi:uncharacterized protein
MMLLTLPRVLGYIFNPISIYYCFDGAGKAICSVVPKSGNTFREMKLYLLGQEQLAPGRHVPQGDAEAFLCLAVFQPDFEFDFKLKVPGDKIWTSKLMTAMAMKKLWQRSFRPAR